MRVTILYNFSSLPAVWRRLDSWFAYLMCSEYSHLCDKFEYFCFPRLSIQVIHSADLK